MPKQNNSNRGNNPAPVTDEQTVTQQRPAHIDNGEEARGNVNARENQTTTQSEPSDAIVAMGDTVVALKAPTMARGSIMETRRKAQNEVGTTRHTILTDVKQKLTEAADLLKEGGTKAKEAQKIIDGQATALFVARADGILDADAFNAMLGDAFGFKLKAGKGDTSMPVNAGHPDASKTPFGQGEALRKRVVRAVQAHEYVAGTDASKFFDGLPKERVEENLKRVRDGKLSLWQAYDNMGKIKQEASNTRPSPALDTKLLGKIVEGLREPTMAERYLNNQDLQDIYLAIHDLIVATDREATALAKAKAA